MFNIAKRNALINWSGDTKDLYDDSHSVKYGCNSDNIGMYCTAIIAQNDWQIPKDYPRKIRY